MKLASFRINGRANWGCVLDEKVRPAADATARLYPTLKDAIAADLFSASGDEIFDSAELPLDAVELLTPVPDTGKILCVGRNYLDHVSETGLKLPEYPSIFSRFPDTLVPSGAALVAPKVSEQYDYEGELCLVIGKGGRHIAKADALSHVFGWSCFNDGSVRDYQLQRSLTAGKNFVSSGSFGPWIVTRDELPDPRELEISTHLNGERVQHSTLSKLIFDVPTLVSYISEFTPLAPGDVISTGTPEGVGLARKPQLWMRAGDIIEVTVSGIGTLRNTVVAET